MLQFSLQGLVVVIVVVVWVLVAAFELCYWCFLVAFLMGWGGLGGWMAITTIICGDDDVVVAVVGVMSGDANSTE